MSEFEKQVRHALIDRDMTMTDLANELGITISYVSDLLKGKRTNQEQLQRIKEFLEITDTEDYEEQNISFRSCRTDECVRTVHQDRSSEGIFPFGYAVKMSTQWTYYISPQKFTEHTGITVSQKGEHYGRL